MVRSSVVIRQGRRLAFGAVVAIVACSGDARPPRAAGTPQASAPAPLVLPATFTGELPCAGCEALATTLTLFDDGTFRRRSVPRGGGPAPLAELGSWRALDGGRRLVLDGTGAAGRQFGRRGADTLQLLDNTGAELVSPTPHVLGRAATIDTIRDPMRLDGAIVETPTQVEFVACASGRRHPVLREGAFDALGRAVRAAQAGQPRPTSARVIARLAPRPAALPGRGEVLVVDSVERAWVGGGCGARRPEG